MSNEIFAGIFILLNLLDAITTYIVMSQKGGKELNPILRWPMRKIGMVPALVIKMVLACGLAYFTLPYAWVLVTMSVLFALVVVNNINVIRRMKK